MMPASLYTHVQQLVRGHRPFHTEQVIVPAGDPLRRKPTTVQRRVYTGRVERVDEPQRGADVKPQAKKPPRPVIPMSNRKRVARYLDQTGAKVPTPRQRRRIDHKDNVAKLRAEKAAKR